MKKVSTILVVDDDPEVRQGLQTVLEGQGYRTLEADNGLEAMHQIGRNRPDLVILDMMMPRLGGFPVLEHYRGKEDAPPFIMITGHTGATHKAVAEQAGAIDFLRKPIAMDRLLARVESVLQPQAEAEPYQAEESQADESTPAPVAPTLPATFICCCVNCDARIKAPMQLRGQTRPCPRCRQPVLVIPAPPEDEGPLLAL